MIASEIISLTKGSEVFVAPTENGNPVMVIDCRTDHNLPNVRGVRYRLEDILIEEPDYLLCEVAYFYWVESMNVFNPDYITVKIDFDSLLLFVKEEYASVEFEGRPNSRPVIDIEAVMAFYNDKKTELIQNYLKYSNAWEVLG